MEIKISFNNREFQFEAKEIKGDSLQDFFSFLRDNSEKITKVIANGETQSYTFKRQVYLLLNILRYAYGCEILLNSSKIEYDVLIPTY